VGVCTISAKEQALPVIGPLKPLVRASRASALVRRSSVSISRALEAALFESAEVLSEGGCRAQGGPRDSYFGSTMISVDLERLRPLFRSGLDSAARRGLLAAVEGSLRVRLRAMRLARAEAARRVPERVLGTAYVETRVWLTDRHLHIDVDLEVPLGVSSASGQP
jgi:hypothetical protein